MFVVVRSVSQGYRAGLVSAAGLSTGALVHVVAATAGLSAILQTSATAFTIVKMLGAGYLIYLGIQTLRARRPPVSVAASVELPLKRIFTDGMIVSVFNPKIALFFLAFLPQFVESAAGPIPQQVMLLGLIYVALALVTDSAYAFVASRLSNWLGGRLMEGPLLRYVSGGIFLGLGVSAALTGRRDL
jgi:threonine/homoserine/homoserine lactone efflux protein